jgi:hypothetical protein
MGRKARPRRGLAAEPEAMPSSSDDPVFEVEALVDSRLRFGVRQYLVKWKNFPPEENTWEDEANLNCPELLRQFRSPASQRPPHRGTPLILDNANLGVFPFLKRGPPAPPPAIEITGAVAEGGAIVYSFVAEGKAAHCRGEELRARHLPEVLAFLERRVLGHAKGGSLP